MTALRDAALELAAAGWPVFPLAGKVPKIPKWAGGRGHDDGTVDLEQIRRWWERWPDCNIGARIPVTLILIDVDPRAGGDATLARWADEHGPLPATLTAWSGRGDGGCHLYWLSPGGKFTARMLKGTGVDLKMPGKGYAVMPPSIHPDSGMPYRWDEPVRHPVPMPRWLVELLRPPRPKPRAPLTFESRPSDKFAEAMSWAELLEPHGWQQHRTHPDRWVRPGKDEGTSASVTTSADGTEWLHVFTSNAAGLDQDANYTKFGLFAALNHRGDWRAAAKAVRR